MDQAITILYPNPSNQEKAIFRMNVHGEIADVPMSYAKAKALSPKLKHLSDVGAPSASITTSKGKIDIDRPLIIEMYAAVVEMVVDVELGADLAEMDMQLAVCH